MKRWVEADGIHIDVRGLPAPQPLVQILSLVRSIDDDPAVVAHQVVVHHDRDPQLLYPELAEIGWSAEIVDGEPGEIRLRLVRSA
ncbi:MAG: DUF2249 domain-containing protein [Burkholderiaceae bacterium]|nr:DUF2249 domain-containing protein [Burkholderiaceae bacterium]